ncbi:TIGR00282 family metallophosphoesterase [bacterium]|nr:TIGR00282 family metallophosphoesterase [bacterium]
MNILFIGDIIGKPGRHVVRELLFPLINKHRIDFCIANAENSAAGFGITQELIHQFLDMGINCLTSGNHIWDKKEVINGLDSEPKLLKPANYPPSTPGNPYGIYESGIGHKVGVLNLEGRVFMPCIDCPFQVAERMLAIIRKQCKVIIVDFHAEATSEKIAMGWYLDGKVTAVVGTHTHVQTADDRILPNGTAYITDVGMTGPFDSVIGIKKEIVLERFLTQMPQKFTLANRDLAMNAALIDCDPETGKARGIERLQIPLP